MLFWDRRRAGGGDVGNDGKRGGGEGGSRHGGGRGKDSGGAPYLIIGLGNPGKEYAATRHNAGFLVIDRLSELTGIGVAKRRFRSLVGEGRHGGRKIVLIKPQTYMNLSGEAASEAANYYKAAPERLILIYDDTDIPFASIRVRPSGSPGTHNGARSVADCLAGWKFPKVRVGIGAPPGRMDIKDYVLARFTAAESEQFAEAVICAADAALDVVALGVDKAMNIHNPKKSPVRNSGRGGGSDGQGDSAGGRGLGGDGQGDSGGAGKDSGGGDGGDGGNGGCSGEGA